MWARPSQGILGGHEQIINKRKHKQSLVDGFLPMWMTSRHIPVVVIGNNHAINLVGKLYDVVVIVGRHSSVVDGSGRSEPDESLLVQFAEDVLVYDVVVGTRVLLPPQRDKHINMTVSSFLEVLDNNLNSTTGEGVTEVSHSTGISMTTGKREEEIKTLTFHTQGLGRDLHTQGLGRDLHTQGLGRDLHTQGLGRDLHTQGLGRDLHTQGLGRDLHCMLRQRTGLPLFPNTPMSSIDITHISNTRKTSRIRYESLSL